MDSLADLQRAPGAVPSTGPAALPLQVDHVRTFDTPEFAGMQFLEVRTKSALNRVKGMPFAWSINPYRGCSHACAYCLVGETPLLMADGRTRPLADVRPGDRVYGTVRVGRHRRYVATSVADQWSTLRRAYRIHLEDGTVLTASADHRFLTDRGWRHVAGEGRGPECRPHLTTDNELIGHGGYPDPPKHTADYKRGYLCGMIRGDGTMRLRGSPSFRLALVDGQGLERTADFLLPWGLTASAPQLFQTATPTRKRMDAIRISGRERVAAITELIAWPTQPGDDWCRGFLAGVFDAEGGYGGGVLRISSTDPVMLGWITDCLRRLRFQFVREPPAASGCVAIRIPGDLEQHLEFFIGVDPAITRKRTIDGQALKSRARLCVVGVEPLRWYLPMFDITTGTGDFIANGVVSHNCFARPTHRYLNMSPLGDFERKVVVKTNLVEVLRRELARPSWKGEHVAMGTNTDPYQRCEGRYRLMPGVIDALAQSRTPFSILTKGTLVTRDLAALRDAAQQVPVAGALTIGMLDQDLWRAVEPGVPSPRARIEAVRTLNAAGIPTGVMLAPIMPGLNDDEEQLAALVEVLAHAGAVHITPIVLHLRPGVREVFWPWLEQHHPELVDTYRGLYRGSNAPKDYRERVGTFVARRREEAWRRIGRPSRPEAWRGGPRAETPAPAQVAEQLRLL